MSGWWGSESATFMEDEAPNCMICGGYGCIHDDPEVRGAVVECDRCGGSGKQARIVSHQNNPLSEILREALAKNRN